MNWTKKKRRMFFIIPTNIIHISQVPIFRFKDKKETTSFPQKIIQKGKVQTITFFFIIQLFFHFPIFSFQPPRDWNFIQGGKYPGGIVEKVWAILKNLKGGHKDRVKAFSFIFRLGILQGGCQKVLTRPHLDHLMKLYPTLH